jgi:NDP-sugar pyrophosphorylase family protein
MILAAGLGTRLRPLTCFRAKPAIPFLGRPLIHYALDLLRGLGVERPVVNLHHLPDTVRRAAGDAVDYSPEAQILGTAGALRQARRWLEGDGTIVLINGKIYFEDPLLEALKHHRRHGAAVTLVLVPPPSGSNYNPVYVDAEGRVRLFGGLENRFGHGPTPDLRPQVFTGVHLIEPEVLDRIPPGFADTVRDLYAGLILQDVPVLGWVSPACWVEVSTPRRYLEHSLALLARCGRGVDPWGRNVVGGEAQLAAGSQVEESVIWDGIQVGPGCRLKRVILAEGSGFIPPGTRLENCIVTGEPEWCPADLHGSIFRDGRRIWPLAPEMPVTIEWGTAA